MSTLFLIVLTIIVVVVGTTMLWRYIYYRRRKRSMAERPERELYADRYFDDHLLDPPPIDKPEPLFDSPLVDPLEETPDTLAPPLEEEPEPLPPPPSKQEIQQDSPTPSPSRKDNQNSSKRRSELIIVLYVVAQDESGFVGSDIFTVLEDIGLKYGEMSIFHHYGLGELKVKNPVFSIANMIEPGIFEPQQMSEFVSPGLALFMRLPGPFGGRVAFEFMLNSAQRLADVLEGLLEDERHTPLDQKKINALRDRIANFEQRSTSLSLLKRLS